MLRKKIKVLEREKGLIVGKKGCTIKRIIKDSGARVSTSVKNMVCLDGSKQQIDAAECMIQSILSNHNDYGRLNPQGKNLAHPTDAKRDKFSKDSLVVVVPEFSISFIFGKNRKNINDIKAETGTHIAMLEQGIFYIEGDKEQQHDAKLRIKEIAYNSRSIISGDFPKCRQFPFIDDRQVSEEAEFSLKSIDNPHPSWLGCHYRLVTNDLLFEERQSEDFDNLRGQILKILQNLDEHKKRDNLLVDMWCHFGHAFIAKVDEAEVDKIYTLQQIKEKLQAKENPWQAAFNGGRLNVKEIEKICHENGLTDQRVPPYTRHDFSIFTPSCRNVRVKVYLKANEVDGGLSSCRPVPVKNLLESATTDEGIKYYLSGQPTKHIKVPIFIPHVHFDCHLIIRTTFKKTTREPEDEEEDKTLIRFLNRNLRIINGELEFPHKKPLPDGFDLAFWRRSERKIFHHSEDENLDFNIKISEERLENMASNQAGKKIESMNDIHLHCDEWDKKLSEGDWHPEEILRRLPAFLRFVSNVQTNLSDQDFEEQDN